MNDIRHLSAAFNSTRIALGEVTNRVQVFDIASCSVVSEFETVLDLGGERLALSPDGKICICGCWERHGIVAYDAESGDVIWQRKDLKKLQYLNCSYQDNNVIFAHLYGMANRMLDIRTGMDVKKLNGIEYFWDSQSERVAVHLKSSAFILTETVNQKTIAKIPKRTFAPLAAAFSENSFAVSESGGPLTCYSSKDGSFLWEVPLSVDGHFLAVSFNAFTNRYVGVTWPFMNGGNKKLKVIDPATGNIESELDINSPATMEFALNGKVLVTSDLMMIDTETLLVKFFP